MAELSVDTEESDPEQRLSAYILCSTPRTGSTLLCSLLASSGCAGVPESYFRAQDLAARAQQWRIRQPDGGFEFAEYLNCVLESGTSDNGVFGVRIMWGTLSELLDQLRGMGMDGSDREVLDQAFGPTRFVYIQRQDRLAQAISRLRAEQTDLWHVTSKADLERRSGIERYDAERIAAFIAESTQHNQEWEAWFSTAGVTPLRVDYEDLNQNAQAVAGAVLKFLGQSAAGVALAAPNLRMSDSLSTQWAARFRAETGYSQ